MKIPLRCLHVSAVLLAVSSSLLAQNTTTPAALQSGASSSLLPSTSQNTGTPSNVPGSSTVTPSTSDSGTTANFTRNTTLPGAGSLSAPSDNPGAINRVASFLNPPGNTTGVSSFLSEAATSSGLLSTPSSQVTPAGDTGGLLRGLQSEAQISTLVQQLEALGPAVVQRLTTQVGGLACTPGTLSTLVDVLHSGKAAPLPAESNQGPAVTIDPRGTQLGYGETYVALAMAAQELRQAGVTTCATPEQWRAALFGGPVTPTGTQTGATGRTTQAPGIVALRTQGRSWSEIAQSTNVSLGQFVSSITGSGDSTTGSLTPTGYPSRSAEAATGSSSTSSATTKTDGKEPEPSSGQSSSTDSDPRNKGKDRQHPADR